ncbi:NUDIX domain-containing protein [Nonomuraea sp. NPDC003709]|uniref:NUDIX hydrolase n=1 Tax=Nonomuraea sp. NPDC003709 TaxID=3154450 RepID=UPI0033ACD969
MVTELVERVDGQDRVLGVVDRDDAIRRGWLHRIATTVCRDELGRFLVYRRAEGLSRYPGHHEVTFGGALSVGESYQAAASRELAEELGIDVPVHEVVKFLCHGKICSYWLGVHEAVIVGDVSPDPEAVSWVGWLTSAELSEFVKQHRFIPDGQEALRRYLEARSASPGSAR